VYEENFEKSSSSLSLGRILLFPSLDFFFLQKKKKKKKEKEKSPIHLSNLILVSKFHLIIYIKEN
jgi:hypothetical protein